MSMQGFQRLIVRRWWVILAVVVLATGGSWIYAMHQPPIYRASATAFAHPSSAVSKPADINADIGLLTYGTLADTFAALAQSRLLLDEAGQDLSIQSIDLSAYSASAQTLPQTTILQISVDGPDGQLAAQLADALVYQVAEATAEDFPTFALTPLDNAVVPTNPIQPVPLHDALYAGLAGLIVGFILAALSAHQPVPSSAEGQEDPQPASLRDSFGASQSTSLTRGFNGSASSAVQKSGTDAPLR
jgi:capsular polysaccharide biosynthesis protein